ncbi:family 2 glycosyl transferase [Nostoc carneum NIES-2107]|nr:family 2 glycosyl transferase [Nostoc carneum NIES-2107]
MTTQHEALRLSQQTYQYVFTVFTATYNRAHTLHRVYKSLKAQTYRDFEWLIIDDGSTDNTDTLVKQWQQESLFPIRYFYKENGGLIVAFNRAVKEANGELFIKLDSDDTCIPEALERFKYSWDAIPKEQKNDFAGVISLSKDEHGKIVGSKFPSDVFDSNLIEVRYRFKVSGENWWVYRTDVLREFPLLELPNEKYVPELPTWLEISRKYKARFINEFLRTYYTSGLDKITIGSKFFGIRYRVPGKFCLGQIILHQYLLNTTIIDYFLYAPEIFIISAIHYSRFSFHCKTSVITQVKSLTTIWSKFLWLFTIPLGYLVYCRDVLIMNARKL